MLFQQHTAQPIEGLEGNQATGMLWWMLELGWSPQGLLVTRVTEKPFAKSKPLVFCLPLSLSATGLVRHV